MQYYRESAGTVLEHLKTTKDGLSASDAHKRLRKHGTNERTAKKGVSPFTLFFGQFKNFIIYILLFAVAISVLANEYVDAVIIIIILLFNAFVGFIQ